MQKFGEVKFSKDRVKIQIWGKPVIFSHELCLYTTRFVASAISLDIDNVAKLAR